MRRSCLLALAGLLVLSVFLSAFAQPQAAKPENLVANSGFEQGGDPGGFKTFQKGDKFPGWTITKGSVDHIGSIFKCAHGRCLDMNGNNLGAIRQSLTTEAGKSYRLTFELSANPQCGEPKKTLRVSAGSQSKSFTVLAKPTIPWTKRTWDFTADGDKTALAFESTGKDSACGPLLDSVSVTLLPSAPAPAAKPQ